MFQTDFEKVKCPICQSDRYQVIAEPLSHHPAIQEKFSIVQCSNCKLRYLNPRPHPESLNKFYKIIHTRPSKSESFVNISNSRDYLTLLKKIWYQINYSNPLLPLIDREPVLDIGCGRGKLLQELLKCGYQASGLELSTEAVSDCLQKGLQVTQGSVETYEIPKNTYKCFVLSHSLEHFLEPIAILRKLKKSLSEDGKIVIAVPYARSPMITLFKNNWHGWDPPFHITHFDKVTIQKVCEEAGLQVKTIKVKGEPEDFTRSLILHTQQPRRYLILRALLLPIFWTIELFGSGSYLLVSAVPKN